MGLFYNNTITSHQTSETTTTTNDSNSNVPTEVQTVDSIFKNTNLDTKKLLPLPELSADTLEYLSLDEGRDASTAFGYIPSRSASDDVFYGTGSFYLLGLGLGGLYGAREGLKANKGAPSKILFNGALNGTTLRGPFVGNTMGMIALGYNSCNALLTSYGFPDNKTTAISSGVITGMLFKSTAGLRSSLITGVICGTLVSIWKVSNEFYQTRYVNYAPQSNASKINA